MDDATDLRNTRARLIRLAIAAVIGGVLAFFSTRAMMSTGHGNTDPVGASIMPLLGGVIFVMATAMAHRILSKKR